MGGDADAELADLADHVDQLGGVGEVLRVVLDAGGRVAGQGEDVLDPGGAVLLEQRHQLGAGVGDARQVGHGGDAGVPLDVDDDVACAVPGRSPRPVGHRHERRVERLQLADRLLELTRRLVGFRRKELERERPAGREQVTDLPHGRPGYATAGRPSLYPTRDRNVEDDRPVAWSGHRQPT
jgi:hypothetical protein